MNRRGAENAEENQEKTNRLGRAGSFGGDVSAGGASPGLGPKWRASAQPSPQACLGVSSVANQRRPREGWAVPARWAGMFRPVVRARALARNGEPAPCPALRLAWGYPASPTRGDPEKGGPCRLVGRGCFDWSGVPGPSGQACPGVTSVANLRRHTGGAVCPAGVIRLQSGEAVQQTFHEAVVSP